MENVKNNILENVKNGRIFIFSALRNKLKTNPRKTQEKYFIKT